MSSRRVRGLVHGTGVVVLATVAALAVGYFAGGGWSAVHTAWSTFLSGFWIYYLAWAAGVIAWQNGESA